MTKYTMETPLEDLELSVRVSNLLARNGCKTLQDANDELPKLKQYANGWGAKCTREVLELVEYATPKEDLFADEKYRAFLFEDKLNNATALIQDVERTMLRVALKGVVRRDARSDMALKLREAAAHIEQLPAIGEANHGQA